MTDPTPPLPRARERLTIAVLTLAAFAVALNTNLVGPLLPFVGDDPMYSGLDAAAQSERNGQLLGAGGLAGALAGLLLGPLVDRFGRRAMMLAGGAAFTVALLAHLLAPSHGALLAARALAGLGGGLVYVSASATVADLVPFARRGAAMGVFTAGLFLAIPLGVPLAILVASGGERAWRVAFALLVVPGLMALAGVARCVPPGLGVAPGGSGARVHYLAVLRTPGVIPALLSVLLYTGAFFTTVQLAAQWLDDRGLLVKERQPPLWIGLGLGTVLGSFALSRLADRTGKRVFVLLTTAGVGICVAVLGRVETLTGLALAGVPLALLAAGRSAGLQALLSQLVEPRLRGTLMGLHAAAVNAGAGLLAWGGGLVYAEAGYRGVTFWAALMIFAAYTLIRFGVKVRL